MRAMLKRVQLPHRKCFARGTPGAQRAELRYERFFFADSRDIYASYLLLAGIYYIAN